MKKRKKWNYKKFLKNISKLLLILLIFWIALSCLDFAIENTQHASGHLHKYNIVVILYKILDYMLQGFIF